MVGWVLQLGVVLAAARWGALPKQTPESLVRPIAILLGVIGTISLAAGLLGDWFLSNGSIFRS